MAILNQVTCYYQKNTPITTYTLADGLSDWVWTGRTLSGLRDESGNFFPADGRQITFTGNSANLSAVWTLNNLPLNVYIIGEGTDEVSVTVKQSNNKWWNSKTSEVLNFLTYSQLPHNEYNSTDIITATNTIQVPYNGALSIYVDNAKDATIESIKYDGKDVTSPIIINGIDSPDVYKVGTDLSVTFIKNGILTYLPNQDYVNPR